MDGRDGSGVRAHAFVLYPRFLLGFREIPANNLFSSLAYLDTSCRTPRSSR